MTAPTQILADKLTPLTLAAGGHSSPDEGMCAMEAAAYIAGEPFSDHPECVSPVIASAMRTWNDGLPDNSTRDRLLKPLIASCIGTRTTDDDERTRSAMALDWIVRVQTPAWLRLAGLHDEASALEALPRIVDTGTLLAAQPALTAAQKAAAARAAAWAAAGAAAGDAAGAAAWAAARAAAGAAAGAAVSPTDTYAVARAKADAAVAGTREQLQASFANLVAAMCDVGRVAAAA